MKVRCCECWRASRTHRRSREYLSYIDYAALLTSRPGVPEITSWAQFSSLMDSKSDASRLTMAALMGIQSGPGFFTQTLMRSQGMPDAVGFDVFTIERAIEFGNPPEQGDVLEGNFDIQAVTDAHTKRGIIRQATKMG